MVMGWKEESRETYTCQTVHSLNLQIEFLFPWPCFLIYILTKSRVPCKKTYRIKFQRKIHGNNYIIITQERLITGGQDFNSRSQKKNNKISPKKMGRTNTDESKN